MLKQKRSRRLLKGAAMFLFICIAVFILLYSLLAFSHIPIFKTARHMLIETAMSTMRHQWVATAFFPKGVVDEVMEQVYAAREEQVGIESTWDNVEQSQTETQVVINLEPPTLEEHLFLDQFYELDRRSVHEYLADHPEALENGWQKFYANEAGLEDAGTCIRTLQGDKVLAVDAENGVLLVQMTGTGFRGVLAIGKDPAKLSVCAASSLPESGQLIGTIAKNNGGVLAITANGFDDKDAEGNEGKGNGGVIAGFAMCNGVAMGDPLAVGFKRVELRTDDRLYIVDSQAPVSEDCTDAAEFTPALIVDGKVLVDEYCGWNAINPRACIGQNSRGEIMMLCIEGRLVTSLGIGVVKCAEMLADYDCVQALNLDGGTSAIMWYRGECVTRCSNTALPYGRTLPNAFVYAGTM